MKRRTSTLLATAIFLGFSIIFSAQAQQAGTTSAQQIVGQMMAAYASCQSYQDTGEVRTVYQDANRPRTVVQPFSTAFVRSAGFRYEFRSRRGEAEWDQYIIWKQGEEVKSWWSLRPNVITDRSFSMSISGATGVSGKSSLTVPGMLMPDELRAGPIKDLTNLQSLGEETLGTRAAYKVEGKDSLGRPTTIWIDKQNLLLLQVFEKRKISRTDGKGEFEVEASTTYQPQMNEAVPASKLAFDPPAQK